MPNSCIVLQYRFLGFIYPRNRSKDSGRADPHPSPTKHVVRLDRCGWGAGRINGEPPVPRKPLLRLDIPPHRGMEFLLGWLHWESRPSAIITRCGNEKHYPCTTAMPMHDKSIVNMNEVDG